MVWDKRAGDDGPRAAHLLLTKFNIRLAYMQGRTPGLDPEWLERRLDLFNAWPLPSVKAQTLAPTAWLILMDAETPPPFLSRLEAISQGAATIVPIEGVPSDADIASTVASYVPAGVDTLVTSRLDNDDALAASYMQTMAREARDWTGFLNPRSGLQLAGGALLRCWDSSSPFLTFVEPWRAGGDPKTVFAIAHHRAREFAPVRQVGGSPLWLQIVHGGNVVNSPIGIPYPHTRAARVLGWPLPEAPGRHSASRLAQAASSQAVHEAKWLARRLARG
jgi:hypothetical protein